MNLIYSVRQTTCRMQIRNFGPVFACVALFSSSVLASTISRSHGHQYLDHVNKSTHIQRLSELDRRLDKMPRRYSRRGLRLLLDEDQEWKGLGIKERQIYLLRYVNGLISPHYGVSSFTEYEFLTIKALAKGLDSYDETFQEILNSARDVVIERAELINARITRKKLSEIAKRLLNSEQNPKSEEVNDGSEQSSITMMAFSSLQFNNTYNDLANTSYDDHYIRTSTRAEISIKKLDNALSALDHTIEKSTSKKELFFRLISNILARTSSYQPNVYGRRLMRESILGWAVCWSERLNFGDEEYVAIKGIIKLDWPEETFPDYFFSPLNQAIASQLELESNLANSIEKRLHDYERRLREQFGNN